MRTVECPIHRNLVLDLARGVLDVDGATVADRVRQECAHCAAWWEEELSGEARRPVDAGVAAALQAFRPSAAQPRLRPAHWAAAAVSLLVVGVLALAPTRREIQSGTSARIAAPGAEQADGHLIWAAGFEASESWQVVGGSLRADLAEGGANLEAGGEENEVSIFHDGLEDGDFKGWSRHS